VSGYKILSKPKISQRERKTYNLQRTNWFLVVYTLDLTYFLKVLMMIGGVHMVIGGIFLVFFGVSSSVRIGDWRILVIAPVLAFISLAMGIALLRRYGKELEA
jgi:hypothetical protein